MKLFNIRIFLFFVLLFCMQNLSAQTATSINTNPPVDPRDPRPEYMRRADDARDKQARAVEKIVEDHRSRTNSRNTRKLETAEERKAKEEEKIKTLEEINALLAAPPAFAEKYSEFLKNKKTGIARIFPDRMCDKGIVVNVKELERCRGTAQIKGAGSIYSFRLNELPNYLPIEMILSSVARSDIHFIDGKFNVGTEWVFDIIADVGEVELTEVNLRSDSIRFLRSFKPEKTQEKVKLQTKEITAGVNENGYYYSTSTPVVLNRTYVLRSIAFNYFPFTSFWNTDVITAFKVVGEEPDGSVVILWKELKESSAPHVRLKKRS